MADKSKYPWLRLLDLDMTPNQTSSPKRRGRPKNSFPRSRLHVTLTDDEKAVLDEMVELFSEKLNQSFSRGHVVAFMVFYLRSLLQQKGKKMSVPDDIDSFVDLAAYLDQKK